MKRESTLKRLVQRLKEMLGVRRFAQLMKALRKRVSKGKSPTAAVRASTPLAILAPGASPNARPSRSSARSAFPARSLPRGQTPRRQTPRAQTPREPSPGSARGGGGYGRRPRSPTPPRGPLPEYTRYDPHFGTRVI